jgi:hypothetical protein
MDGNGKSGRLWRKIGNLHHPVIAHAIVMVMATVNASALDGVYSSSQK